MSKQSNGGSCDTPLVTLPLSYGIDYLTCTHKSSSNQSAKKEIQDVLKRLAIVKTIGESKERNGFAGFDILGARGFAGTRGDEAMIEVQGQGIEVLRKYKISDDEFLHHFDHKIWRASRVDFSMDTRNEEITPALVAKAWHHGHATCRADNIREIKETRPDGRFSHTVYIGSQSSQRMLRVYDKRTQLEFVMKVEPGAPPWTRFELQNRHAAAIAAVQHMQRNGVQSGRALLNGWITFTDPKSRIAEVCRRPAAPWWTEIVGGKKALSA